MRTSRPNTLRVATLLLAGATLVSCTSRTLDEQPTPPTVAITAPASGASIAINTAVPVTATATDDDGTVSQVEFFDGTTSLGVAATSPYTISWTPTVAGAHSLTAKATDNDGNFTNSAAVAVTVTDGSGGDTEPPTVTIADPLDGLATPLTGTVVATGAATDNVGVVAVEFQLDGESLGEATSSPYKLALPPLANYTTGPHQIRARARDAAGNLSPWALARVTFGGNVNLPLDFVRTAWIQNLATVGTAMAFSPDGRLFICEQSGALRVVKNNALVTTPFVTVPTTADGERGLLGVTFHPQFGTAGNNFVYVYYTSAEGGAHNRISRYPTTATGDLATGPEEVILDLPALSSATNHNGGAIHFGPDGKLYVAVGENANSSNAQLNTTLLGKILRLNPDGSIPPDNPTIGTGSFKAIWAKGVRNPFTFTFQPGSGRMFINDVGESTWEEINEGAAGANYGWATAEGNSSNPSFTNPLFTYRHSGGAPTNPSLVVGQAIVGSAFYNPSGAAPYPASLVGSYFFADYVSKWINRLDLPTASNAVYAFARLPDSVTDLAVGPDGKLYALAVQANGSWGVFRFDKN